MTGPNDCDRCDGYGRVWNNADPTSGQWAECEACSPPGVLSKVDAATLEALRWLMGRPA